MMQVTRGGFGARDPPLAARPNKQKQAPEWTSFPPLFTTVSITPEGAEPPDSRRTEVIGALVFLPSETGQTLLSLAGQVAH